MKPRWWIERIIGEHLLTMDGRALLVWMGTRPTGWRYSVEECLTATGWGRQKFQAVLREVKDAGWVVASYKRDRRGRIKHTAMVVRDTAQKAENQASGYPATGGRVSRLPVQKAENQPRLRRSNGEGEGPSTWVATHRGGSA